MKKEEHNQKGLSRRDFIKGAAAGAVSMAAMGIMGACSAADTDAGTSLASTTAPKETTAVASSAEIGNEEESKSRGIPEISENLDTDIVIVGAGISGLAAAVQAAQDGNKVIVLEKGAQAGGNGSGTEGIFAIDSNFQKEQGIHIELVDIIAKELEGAQYRVDASFWVDMISKSGENLDWLQEHGVKFTGVVDNYHTGMYDTMHWFTGDFGGGGANFVPPMQAAAEGYGAEFRMETRATSLIYESGVVSGLYAVDGDGNGIRINAKAVIVASGGIGYNKELLLKQGWSSAQIDNMAVGSVPTIEGDGYKMAMEVGAKDFLPCSCDQVFNVINAYAGIPGMSLADGGPVIWVNQDARRFTNEEIHWINFGATSVTNKNNRATYAVYDQAILDTFTENPEVAEKVKNALNADNEDSLFAADTLEDIAGHFGLDVEAFKQTVARYNDFCKTGKDLDIGKSVQFLKAIETPPYYIAKIVNMFVAIDGGITTNIRTEALDNNLNTIPGLYAVGLDGAMLWRNIYTQNIPGTLMGHNVNSGRNAAKNAKVYISAI